MGEVLGRHMARAQSDLGRRARNAGRLPTLLRVLASIASLSASELEVSASPCFDLGRPMLARRFCFACSGDACHWGPRA